MGDRPTQQGQPVAAMDPRHVLSTGSERASGKRFERDDHPGESTAVRVEDDPGPDERNPCLGTLRLQRVAFPLDREICQEVSSGRGLLRQDLVTAVTVIADGRGADEHGWRFPYAA